MEKQNLERVLDWANKKIAAGEEPPWSWYQYMKLRETLEAILTGMAATTTESSPQSDEHLETHLRLVGSTDPQDNVPRRPVGLPVQTPM
jgi:hypothetical protein